LSLAARNGVVLAAPATSAPTSIQVPVYLDGYQIAMATVPHVPTALRRRGVA
jgi:hypothetical protein